MYAKIANNQVVKYPYNNADIRKDNPNVSFPEPISDATLAEYGVVKVADSSAPTFDNKTHRAVEQSPVLENGVWKKSWAVVQLSDEVAAANVRAERDKRIAETDWLVIKNLELNQNVPGKWEVYRQDLRDIPQQPGFPHEITWPVKPT